MLCRLIIVDKFISLCDIDISMSKPIQCDQFSEFMFQEKVLMIFTYNLVIILHSSYLASSISVLIYTKKAQEQCS